MIKNSVKIKIRPDMRLDKPWRLERLTRDIYATVTPHSASKHAYEIFCLYSVRRIMRSWGEQVCFVLKAGPEIYGPKLSGRRWW
jgi:hypothetical protein